MKAEDLGYIAGMLDGEGHITFFSKPDRYSSMHVGITNTNLKIVERCTGIFTEMGCNPKVYYSDPRPDRWKKRATILLTNQKDCLLFLKTILPHLTGKKERAELAILYIESRQKKAYRRQNAKLTPEEEQMISDMRILNKRGPSNGV